MKKLYITAICILLAALLTGCTDTPQTDKTTNAPQAETTAVSETETETISEKNAEESAFETQTGTQKPTQPQTQKPTVPATVPATKPQASTFTVKELRCQNADKSIYGKIYIPDGLKDRAPTVILSHSAMLTHTSMNTYCTELAKKGFVAYCFDFCGGSRNSQSDGKQTDMTIFTEISDLEAVLKKIKTLSYVDTSRIFLFGTSQGGLVSALTAEKHISEIRGMILLYPGFNIAEQVSQFNGNMAMAGMMGIGRDYLETLKDYDVYANIGKFRKDVIIVHGTSDTTVPIRYSQRAVEIYPSAKLYTIKGGNHGFNADNMVPAFMDRDKEVLPIIFDYLNTHI